MKLTKRFFPLNTELQSVTELFSVRGVFVFDQCESAVFRTDIWHTSLEVLDSESPEPVEGWSMQGWDLLSALHQPAPLPAILFQCASLLFCKCRPKLSRLFAISNPKISMTLNRTYMISKRGMVALMANFFIQSFPPRESELSWKNNSTKNVMFYWGVR